MKQKISILGCGWLGQALASKLLAKGYAVNGSTTSPEKLQGLKALGIKTFLIDLSKDDLDLGTFLNCEVLIISINLKQPEAFKELVKQIENSQLQKVIFISSTSVYPNINDIVTEECPTRKTVLAEIEKLFIANPYFQSTILRFGGLFGYDRKPGNFIKAKQIVDNPEAFINFIHRDDCIGIIEQIIVQDQWAGVLNACTDDHPTRRAFYQIEAQKLGRFNLEFNEQASNDYKIISSEKMKSLLNYSFKYPKLI